MRRTILGAVITGFCTVMSAELASAHNDYPFEDYTRDRFTSPQQYFCRYNNHPLSDETRRFVSIKDTSVQISILVGFALNRKHGKFAVESPGALFSFQKGDQAVKFILLDAQAAQENVRGKVPEEYIKAARVAMGDLQRECQHDVFNGSATVYDFNRKGLVPQSEWRSPNFFRNWTIRSALGQLNP